MIQELSRSAEQEILKKLSRLEAQQIAEVLDFIDFLIERKSPKLPLVEGLTEILGPGVSLEEVRQRLAKISGNMSDSVRELRGEQLFSVQLHLGSWQVADRLPHLKKVVMEGRHPAAFKRAFSSSTRPRYCW